MSVFAENVTPRCAYTSRYELQKVTNLSNSPGSSYRHLFSECPRVSCRDAMMRAWKRTALVGITNRHFTSRNLQFNYSTSQQGTFHVIAFSAKIARRYEGLYALPRNGRICANHCQNIQHCDIVQRGRWTPTYQITRRHNANSMTQAYQHFYSRTFCFIPDMEGRANFRSPIPPHRPPPSPPIT